MLVSHSDTRPFRSTQTVILQGACELMVSHGFGGMSMRALAQHARIQPGSLYNYFSCKQDILEEVVEWLITERIHEWRVRKPRCRNPASQLDAFLSVYFDTRTGHRAAQRLLATELRHLGDASRERVKSYYAVYAGELRGIIDRGNALGAFNAQQSAVAASTILAMLDGLLGTGQLHFDSSNQRSMLEVRRVVDKILGAG